MLAIIVHVYAAIWVKGTMRAMRAAPSAPAGPSSTTAVVP
jgi:cytochrome b subunit of formate dehydrogenase